jgi:hypothetical protein
MEEMDMGKETYEILEISIVRFENIDIITDSDGLPPLGDGNN